MSCLDNLDIKWSLYSLQKLIVFSGSYFCSEKCFKNLIINLKLHIWVFFRVGIVIFYLDNFPLIWTQHCIRDCSRITN